MVASLLWQGNEKGITQEMTKILGKIIAAKEITMAVTIRQIMDIDIVRERMQLMAGQSGLNNVISFVTIMEAPDLSDWVTGGEFVLTTWYVFSHHPELQETAFINLANNGIAGIGIKVNRFVQAIPAEILALGDKYNIPVFAVSRVTKFRELIYAISAELSNYQANLLLEVEKHYKELVECALAENGLDPLLRSFGRRRHCSCLCITPGYKILGAYSSRHSGIANDVVIEKIVQHLEAGNEITTYTYVEGLHVFACRAKEALLGYLVVVDKEPLNERFSLMANQLATFLTLKLLDIVETEQEQMASLLDEILFKHNLDEEETRERLKFFGLKPKGYFRVFIVSLTGTNLNDTRRMKKLREYGAKIKSIVKDAIVIEKYGELVLLATNQTQDQHDCRPKWLKSLLQYILACKDPLLVSVGPSVVSSREMDVSYEVAKRALGVAPALLLPGVLYYADYLARTHLLQSADTPERRYLMAQAIYPLLEEDRIHDTNLISTLEAAMFADKLENVAVAMHVHVNTVRYRMNKIASLTGYDFFSPIGRYVLTTAFLLHSHENGS